MSFSITDNTDYSLGWIPPKTGEMSDGQKVQFGDGAISV